MSVENWSPREVVDKNGSTLNNNAEEVPSSVFVLPNTRESIPVIDTQTRPESLADEIGATLAELQHTDANYFQDKGAKWRPEGSDTIPETSARIRRDFEEQFSRPKMLRLSSGTLEYTMIDPHVNISDRWVVFVGGFNSSARTYKSELLSIVEAGRKVLFANPENSGTVTAKRSAEHAQPELTDIDADAEAIRLILAAENIVEADFVAHSRGAALASSLIASNPELARKVILDCPVGLARPKSMWDLIDRAREESLARKELPTKTDRRFFDDLRAEPAQTLLRLAEEVTVGDSRFWSELISHFPSRVKEMSSIVKFDIRPLLKKIKVDADRGGITKPEVILLTAHEDKIVPADEVEHTIGGELTHLKELGITSWVNYADENAGHGITETAREEQSAGVHSQILDPNNPLAWKVAAKQEQNERRRGIIADLLTEKVSLGVV